MAPTIRRYRLLFFFCFFCSRCEWKERERASFFFPRSRLSENLTLSVFSFSLSFARCLFRALSHSGEEFIERSVLSAFS